MSMRLVGLAAALAAISAPVLAQGTFNPGGQSGAWKPATPGKPAPGFGALPSPQNSTPNPPPSRPPGYGAGGFVPPVRPGEPHKPRTYGIGSVYGSPQAPSRHRGAKPCETSVYVNACER